MYVLQIWDAYKINKHILLLKYIYSQNYIWLRALYSYIISIDMVKCQNC